jgi:hypothetical protein
VLLDTAAPSANCSGSHSNPTAAPGYFCLYEFQDLNRTLTVMDPTGATPGTVGAIGFTAVVTSRFASPPAGDQLFLSRGTWAVTAPP